MFRVDNGRDKVEEIVMIMKTEKIKLINGDRLDVVRIIRIKEQ
jgi:hypothetical protein